MRNEASDISRLSFNSQSLSELNQELAETEEKSGTWRARGPMLAAGIKAIGSIALRTGFVCFVINPIVSAARLQCMKSSLIELQRNVIIFTLIISNTSGE
jgi:hypothetical protein